MFDVKRPCSDCPFRREGGVRLVAWRIREIVRGVTTNPGATFACHKTTGVAGGEAPPGGPQMCAGALIFADKLGRLAHPQLTRIMMRIGQLDPDALRGREDVFDSLAEMLDTAIPTGVGRRSMTKDKR